jgi:hypothetical protein
MAGGGRRPGAGRPRGSANKRTLALKEALAARGAEHPELVLAEFMLDKGQSPEIRIDAAKALMPYVHSKMPTALDLGLQSLGPVEIVIRGAEE